MSEPINWCNLKENIKHVGEVSTSRQGGSPSGKRITTSKNAVTGDERDTLDGRLDKISGVYIGEYKAGLTFSSYAEYVVYNGQSYKPKSATALPFTTTNISTDLPKLAPFDNAQLCREYEEKADASADRAESAAEAAAASGKIYLTVDAGIAATADNELFLVVSDKESGFSDLYLNDAGAGVYQGKTTVEAHALNSLSSDIVKLRSQLIDYAEVKPLDNGIHPIVVDADNRALVWFDEVNDRIVTAGYNPQKTEDALSELTAMMSEYSEVKPLDNGIHPIVVDADNRSLLWFDEKENAVIAYGINHHPSRFPKKRLNHILFYGQSLSVGAAGRPALSTSQPYQNMTFAGGPRAAEGEFLPLKPLAEDNLTAPDGLTNRGETPCSACASYATTELIKKNGTSPQDYTFLASSAGRSGSGITGLMKGSSWYNNIFIKHLENGFAADNSYALHAVNWVQGHGDVVAGTTESDYFKYLTALLKDITHDYQQITGNTNSPVMLLSQLSAHVDQSCTGDVSEAQLNICRGSQDFWFVTPDYHLPYSGDGIHLSNIGYKLMGCYFGRLYSRLLMNLNPKNIPIEPLSSYREGRDVYIRFDVEYPPLVIDTVALGETKDAGFAVADNTNNILDIESISVVNDVFIKITLEAEPSGDLAVRYAKDYVGVGVKIGEGGSGNLRDSNTDTVVINNTTYPLFNVAPHFKLTAYEVSEI